MDLFETLVETLKKNPKKIVFTEGTDARILSAASRLLAGKVLKVIPSLPRSTIWISR